MVKNIMKQHASVPGIEQTLFFPDMKVLDIKERFMATNILNSSKQTHLYFSSLMQFQW